MFNRKLKAELEDKQNMIVELRTMKEAWEKTAIATSKKYFKLLNEKQKDAPLPLTDSELKQIAYALECRYGFGDDLANKIYDYLLAKTGEDYRL